MFVCYECMHAELICKFDSLSTSPSVYLSAHTQPSVVYSFIFLLFK